MFPALVIWNETIHIKKTWSTNSLLCLWLPHSCWRIIYVKEKQGTLQACTVEVKTDYISDIQQKVCRESPVGMEDEAVSCKIASQLYCDTVYKNVLTVIIICQKIYPCFLCKPQNISTTKISRSTVTTSFEFGMLQLKWVGLCKR